ncbi:MAG: A24 family peptidase [Lautropia sp.]|nr:A24 family peptidase [Lautropia sp.]
MGIDAQFWVSPAFTLILAGLIGLLIGSFLNVVIHRLPLMMQARWQAEAAELQASLSAQELAPAPREPFNLMVPRSRCPSCGHAISALENIPVLSWMFLKGACRGCGTRIPLRYPMVEIATALLALSCIWVHGLSVAGVAAAAFCCVLLTLALIDFDTHLLPDSLTLPLLWAGLLLNLGPHGFSALHDAVIGAAAGYLSLWSVYWLFKLLTGKEGMGYGDFKLLAAIGAWFGWQSLPAVILISSVIGAIVGIGLILFLGHGREQPIPFGPYLAGAGLVALFCRDDILRWLMPVGG